MPAQSPARRPLKSRSNPWAHKLAHWLSRRGVSPNAISLASVAMAGIAAWCLLRGLYLPAALFIQFRLLCNLLDGMVAIEGGRKSASGEIFNDLPDRVSDALILVGAGYAITWPSFARDLGWVATYLAVLTAYIRVLGGACGLPQDFRGPIAKPQRMAIMTGASLYALVDTRAIAVGLLLVIAGSLITVLLRTGRIVRQLETRP